MDYGSGTAFVSDTLTFGGDTVNFSIGQSALQPITHALHITMVSLSIGINLYSPTHQTSNYPGKSHIAC